MNEMAEEQAPRDERPIGDYLAELGAEEISPQEYAEREGTTTLLYRLGHLIRKTTKDD